MRGAAVALWLGLPSLAAASSLTTDPSIIVLGRTPVAKLTLMLDGAQATREKLRLTVNVGELGPPKQIGPATYEASYTPPATKFPQMALLGVWRDGATGPAEFLRLPLHGVTKVPVTSKPGAEVSARIGDAVFGPEVVSPRGTAEISVVVPPGAKDTVILAKVAGVTTQRTVGLEVPPYSRLAAAINPGATGPGFTGTARLDVLYDVESGQVAPQAIRIRPSAGTVTLESVEGTRLRYRFELPKGAGNEVTFTLTVDGDPGSPVRLGLFPEAEITAGVRVGARLGVVHSLTELVAGRLAADGLAWLDWGGQTFALGLTLGYGGTSRDLDDGSGTPVGRADLTLLPATLRLTYAPLRLGNVSIHLGAGGTGTALHYRVSSGGAQPTTELTRLTFGLLFFAGASWKVGPGQGFAELTATSGAVDDPGFRAEAGGLGLEIGYRVDVLGR